MASSFGEILRKFRENSKEANSSKRLSQERLGELIGEDLGTWGGYSGPSVSYWENGKTQIHASERGTLLAILRVLYKHGGLASIQEANILLEAGNYKSLSPEEQMQIFPKHLIEESGPPSFLDKYPNWILFLSRSIFFENKDLADKLAQAEDGPPPSWPRKLVVLINGGMSGWSIIHTVYLFLWMMVWLLGYRLLIPSFRWPFHDQIQALLAIVTYVAGSMSIPILAGLFTNTRSNPFWKELRQVNILALRLYTYQGAFVGFHLGYFVIFALRLVSYYFGSQFALWQEILGIFWIVLNAYLGAQLIPFNLWRAFKRLDLADGAIFFIFILLGPIWGYFFYIESPTFLDPFFGPLVTLSACALLIFGMAWESRKTGSTILPMHWWVFLGGLVAVLYQITVTQSIFSVVVLTGIIVSLSVLLALDRVQVTLRGLLGILVIMGLLQIVLSFNLWLGRGAVILALLIWWRWGKKYLSFPPVFWMIIAILAFCLWVWQRQWVSDLAISIFFGATIMSLLGWEYRKKSLFHQSS